MFRRHASVYMAGLRSIIYSMDAKNELAAQLNRIAKAHIKWNIHRSHIQVGGDTPCIEPYQLIYTFKLLKSLHECLRNELGSFLQLGGFTKWFVESSLDFRVSNSWFGSNIFLSEVLSLIPIGAKRNSAWFMDSSAFRIFFYMLIRPCPAFRVFHCSAL